MFNCPFCSIMLHDHEIPGYIPDCSCEEDTEKINEYYCFCGFLTIVPNSWGLLFKFKTRTLELKINSYDPSIYRNMVEPFVMVGYCSEDLIEYRHNDVDELYEMICRDESICRILEK